MVTDYNLPKKPSEFKLNDVCTFLEKKALRAFLSRYKNSPGTYKLRVLEMKTFVSWCKANHLPFLTAERSDLEMYLDYLVEIKGNSPKTANSRRSTLSTFYKVCQADGLITRDPTYMLTKHRVWDEPDIIWLDVSQVTQLAHEAYKLSPTHEALVRLMYDLGLRVSEACNVKIEDFQSTYQGHRVLRVIGKGKKPDIMPIPIPLLRVLERCAEGRTRGYLLLRRNGRPHSRNSASAWVKIIAKKAGIEGVHPHAFRHASITAALDANLPLRDVQAFARHSDVRTTLKIYDRNKNNLDRHVSYTVSSLISGSFYHN